jgi:hypothetical protein
MNLFQIGLLFSVTHPQQLQSEDAMITHPQQLQNYESLINSSKNRIILNYFNFCFNFQN